MNPSSFQAVLGEAIKNDVLFMHVDCGAFTPHRWNPATREVEYWSIAEDRWCALSANARDGDADDWMITKRKRSEYEKIVYED